MRLYFDESGDFAFPDNGFDAYTQAALIIPDSKLAAVEEYVREQQDAWGVTELHASELDRGQILEVCRFIRSQRLPALVQATDTNAMTRKIIGAHRLAQAVRTHENSEWWKSAGGDAPSIERWYEKQVTTIAYSGRVSDSEWVQADLLVSLIHRILNKTIVWYRDDKWRDDFADFHFVLDRKLTTKLAAGEKYLDGVILPALGSNRGRLNLIGIIEWKDPPVHPFEAKFGTGEGAIDLRRLFEHGLEFAASEEHAGLQLADAVAHVARQRIVAPSETVHIAWQTLRPLLLTETGQPIHLLRYAEGGADADTSRYTRL